MFCLPHSPERSALFLRSLELTMPHGALDALMLPVLRIHAQRESSNAEPLKAAGLLFAGDHAVARHHEVSAYPVEVLVAGVERRSVAFHSAGRRRCGSAMWEWQQVLIRS